jgi:hypothetical protein
MPDRSMREYGKSRDEKILAGLEKFNYMRSDQIADIYFQSVKEPESRLKKTSERMRKMHARGYVQRFRFPSEPFIYTIAGNKYNTKINHYLAVVDVWRTLRGLKPSGGNLYCEVERKEENIITDLFIEYTNHFTGIKKEYYIEVELDSKGDILEKLEKYEALFWLRKARKQPEGYLCIIYKNKRTWGKIEAYEGEIPINILHLSEVRDKWTW